MPFSLKILMLNCLFMGMNIANFIHSLIMQRIFLAAISAAFVPVSIWGIHISLRAMRLHFATYMQAYTNTLVQEVTKHYADNKSAQSD